MGRRGGSRRPAHFAGAGLILSVAGAGAVIDADGVISVPTGALLAEEPVLVTARNSAGSATAVFRVSVAAAAGAAGGARGAGGAADLVLEQGGGARTVSAQAGFAGEELVFALAAAPAGVTIESGSGLVRIPTDAPIPRTPVVVRASNAGGAAEQTSR